MKVRIPRDLTLRTFDPLLNSLNQLTAAEELHIDLSRLRWTEPAGLLPFVCRLQSHILGGGSLRIDAFPEVEKCGYLERMNFYNILGVGCPHKPRARRADHDRFIEITKIGSHALSQSARSKLGRLVERRAGGIEGVIGDSFLAACGELVDNTKHAYNLAVDSQADKWPHALIHCQYYPNKKSLHVCVADCGVGIKKSIGAKDPDLYKDDKAAIEAALILGMRGGLGAFPGRGLGLAAIRRFMDKNSGRFAIRSGECLAILTPHKKTYTVPLWKGTVVVLEIRTDRQVDISVIMSKMGREVQQ